MIHHNYPAVQARCDQYKSADLIAFDRILDARARVETEPQNRDHRPVP